MAGAGVSARVSAMALRTARSTWAANRAFGRDLGFACERLLERVGIGLPLTFRRVERGVVNEKRIGVAVRLGDGAHERVVGGVKRASEERG